MLGWIAHEHTTRHAWIAGQQHITAASLDVLLPQALAAATGRKEASIKGDYEQSGDLGVVAANCRSAQRTMFPLPPLTIAGVLKAFKEIAK